MAETKRSKKQKLAYRNGIQKAQTSPKKKRSYLLSSLERLPMELLSDIFLLSENINLPKASPSLGRTLSHQSTKRQFVFHMFDDFRDTLEEEEVQSGLLRQKWFTYDFLRDCQKLFLRKTCVKWYHKKATDTPSSTRKLVTDAIYAYFDWYYAQPSRSYYQQMPPGFQHNKHAEEKRYLYPDYKITRAIMNIQEEDSEMPNFTGSDGLVFRMVDNDEKIFQFTLRDNGAQITFPKSITHKFIKDEPKERSIRFPEYMFGIQLPSKLLHGPWTQDKGDFLSLLLARGAEPPERMQHKGYEVAERGLRDAIKEENICALNLFLSNAKFCTQAANSVIFFQSDISKPKQVSDLSIDLSPLQPKKNPWLYHSQYIHRRLGIEPTMQHLATSLYPRGSYLKHRVNFLVLYHIAKNCHRMDPYDPDILTWMAENFPDRISRKGMVAVKFPIENGEQGEARFEWRFLSRDPFDRLLEVYTTE